MGCNKIQQPLAHVAPPPPPARGVFGSHPSGCRHEARSAGSIPVQCIGLDDSAPQARLHAGYLSSSAWVLQFFQMQRLLDCFQVRWSSKSWAIKKSLSFHFLLPCACAAVWACRRLRLLVSLILCCRMNSTFSEHKVTLCILNLFSPWQPHRGDQAGSAYRGTRKYLDKWGDPFCRRMIGA